MLPLPGIFALSWPPGKLLHVYPSRPHVKCSLLDTPPPRPPTKAGLTTPTFGFPVSSTDLPMKRTTLYFSLTVSPVLFYPTLDSLKEKTPKPTGGGRYSINAACRGTRAFTNECPSPPPRFQKITNKERAGEFPSVPAAAPGRSSGSEGRRLSLGHGELGSAGPRF